MATPVTGFEPDEVSGFEPEEGPAPDQSMIKAPTPTRQTSFFPGATFNSLNPPVQPAPVAAPVGDRRGPLQWAKDTFIKPITGFPGDVANQVKQSYATEAERKAQGSQLYDVANVGRVVSAPINAAYAVPLNAVANAIDPHGAEGIMQKAMGIATAIKNNIPAEQKQMIKQAPQIAAETFKESPVGQILGAAASTPAGQAFEQFLTKSSGEVAKSPAAQATAKDLGDLGWAAINVIPAVKWLGEAGLFGKEAQLAFGQGLKNTANRMQNIHTKILTKEANEGADMANFGRYDNFGSPSEQAAKSHEIISKAGQELNDHLSKLQADDPALNQNIAALIKNAESRALNTPEPLAMQRAIDDVNAELQARHKIDLNNIQDPKNTRNLLDLLSTKREVGTQGDWHTVNSKFDKDASTAKGIYYNTIYDELKNSLEGLGGGDVGKLNKIMSDNIGIERAAQKRMLVQTRNNPIPLPELIGALHATGSMASGNLGPLAVLTGHAISRSTGVARELYQIGDAIEKGGATPALLGAAQRALQSGVGRTAAGAVAGGVVGANMPAQNGGERLQNIGVSAALGGTAAAVAPGIAKRLLPGEAPAAKSMLELYGPTEAEAAATAARQEAKIGQTVNRTLPAAQPSTPELPGGVAPVRTQGYTAQGKPIIETKPTIKSDINWFRMKQEARQQFTKDDIPQLKRLGFSDEAIQELTQKSAALDNMATSPKLDLNGVQLTDEQANKAEMLLKGNTAAQRERLGIDVNKAHPALVDEAAESADRILAAKAGFPISTAKDAKAYLSMYGKDVSGMTDDEAIRQAIAHKQKIGGKNAPAGNIGNMVGKAAETIATQKAKQSAPRSSSLEKM